jgi:hypothetical protein
MNSVERFKKRKHVLEHFDTEYGWPPAVDPELVRQALASPVDFASIRTVEEDFERVYTFDLNVEVSDQEVDDLLKTLQSEFDDHKFDALISSCKNNILSALVGPFGLGGLVAKGDKNGGNVDTVHNVREGVYATEQEKERYGTRGEYDHNVAGKYHSHANYVAKNRADSQAQEAGTLKDAYTGKDIGRNAQKNLDHTKAAKEIHDDPGRLLAELDGPTLANQESNLHATTETINKTKKQKSMEEYLAYVDKKVKELKSKGNLSENEKTQLSKLEQQKKDIDPEKAKTLDKKAREEYNKAINRAYYTSGKFVQNMAKSGAREGAKMGAQQALGLLLCEFFQAVFDEIKDIYKNGFEHGFEEQRFFEILKNRLTRISQRIIAKWKDACKAFREGFISGFLSNLVTVVINMFVRTGKRAVRIIREGFFSLLKALKMLCCPPAGMTVAEAAHEASKLIAAGLATVGGIALEQYIDGLIKATPFLEPFADILTTVLVGGLTGLATTFIIYAIDKIDLFKVNDKARHECVMNKLEADLGRMFAEGDVAIESMSFSCA